MQVTADGQIKPYGKRRHACLNNDLYRQYSKDVATAMAKAFAGNKNIVGFQIDNELGAEEPYCYCPVCQKRFAGWLRTKYKNIETLNKAWNTTFWSETLDSFDQVWLPRKGDSPSAFQDFQIFNSDCIIDFFNLQWQDNTAARILDNDLNNIINNQGKEPEVKSQLSFYDYLRDRNVKWYWQYWI